MATYGKLFIHVDIKVFQNTQTLLPWFDITNNAKLFDHYQQQYLHKRHLLHDSHRLGGTYEDTHIVRG